MEDLKLIQLAKEYCLANYGINYEVSNHIQIENIPQIQTARILSEHGYTKNLIQCIAILSEIYTKPESITGKIKKKFGYEIANGLFLLSKDTLSEENINQISRITPITYSLDKDEIYRIRLTFARKSIKRVKLAQILRDLESNDSKIIKKIHNKKGYFYFINNFYLPMANEIAPTIASKIKLKSLEYMRDN